MNKPKVAGASTTQSSVSMGVSGPSASRLSTGGLDTSSQQLWPNQGQDNLF